MRFSDIPSHSDVKQRLITMADEGRLPHALLLHGSPGIGKMALAQALAQYIHCTNRQPGGDSCGKCPACLQHAGLNHIDTSFTYPVLKREGGKETLSTDYAPEWRDYLTGRTFMDYDRWSDLLNGGKTAKQLLIPRDEARDIMRRVATTAHTSGRKFVIIWLPERMNEAAANALLKVIEEPFPDTSFLLVSDNPEEIIGTIRSRCQAVEVPRPSESDIAAWLTASKGLAPADAAAIARLAAGSMAEAERQADTRGESSEHLDMFIQLMRLAYSRDVGALRAWANKLAATGRERQVSFYSYCCRLIRENFIFNFNEPQLVCLNEAEAAFSARFARFITERNAAPLAEAMNSALTDIEGNGNGKIVNFDLAIRVILLLK